MRKIVKRLVTTFYKPILEKYLAKTRMFRYENIELIVPPEVFHPGFFFSTKLLIKYIKKLQLGSKTFLELGAGSGLISIIAAKKMAIVTSTDINPIAIQTLGINSERNGVELRIIESDMFKNVPKQKFEFMIINPPFYKRNPSTYKEYAWFCGENGEYFQSLFRNLSEYVNNDSHVAMILSGDCDRKMIGSFAEEHGFHMNCVIDHKNLMEDNFIYRIEKR